MKVFLRGASILFVLLFFATGAFAQATRTWVSGVGDDANPCSRTAPCKTFAGAISKTAAGGEIDALDPGGFGAVTITKSITIDGGSNAGGITGANTTGITINAAAATDVITIRRLQINGAGTGIRGVNVIAAKQVNLEDVAISGFTGNGVNVAASTNLQIANSRIENNGGAGVFISAGNASISASALVGNTYAGIDVNGASPVAFVSNSNLSMNGRGIHTGGSALVRITHLDIFANTVYTWEINGGQIQTYVDNRVLGTGFGSLTPVPYP